MTRCTNCGDPLPERELTLTDAERWIARNREAAMRMLVGVEKAPARFALEPKIVERDGESVLRVERAG
jgi:hypothetical protein